jgi:hypothetical protein
MKLLTTDDTTGTTTTTATTTDPSIVFQPQQDEIAAIRWMSVKEFCGQSPWQDSPLYTTLNHCILKVSQAAVVAAKERNVDDVVSEASLRRHLLPMMEHHQLEVGLGRVGMTNALFLPPSSTSSDSSRL